MPASKTQPNDTQHNDTQHNYKNTDGRVFIYLVTCYL
jgi:hypothetical protein